MNARLVVVMMAIALSGMVGASEKRWMCPQMEMELFRVHAMRDDVRRMGLYAGHPGRLPETRASVMFRRTCANDAPLPETWGSVRSTRYDEAEGRRYVEVRTLARCSDEFLIDGVKRNCGGLSTDEVMILTERRHISAR